MRPPAGKRLERCELGLSTAVVDSEGGKEAGTHLPATFTVATGKHCCRDSGVFCGFFFCILVTSRQLHRHHRSRESAWEGRLTQFQCPVTCFLGAKRHWQQWPWGISSPRIAVMELGTFRE